SFSSRAASASSAATSLARRSLTSSWALTWSSCAFFSAVSAFPRMASAALSCSSMSFLASGGRSSSPLMSSPIRAKTPRAASTHNGSSRRRIMITSSHVVEKTRETGEDVAQPLQGPDVAVAGGGLLQAEHLRRLVVGQLLEVPQHQHLAVDRVEGVEDLLES